MTAFSLTYMPGVVLTLADQTNGPIFHSHMHAKTRAESGQPDATTIGNGSRANEAAAIAAGDYFFIDLAALSYYEYALTEMKLRGLRPFGATVNYTVRLATGVGYRDIANSEVIGSGTFSGGGMIATADVSFSEALSRDRQNRLFVVAWITGFSTWTLALEGDTELAGTWVDNRVYKGYPAVLDTFRSIENRPGVIFDPNKKTSIYAEDMLVRGEGLKELEAIMGINPMAINSTMSEMVGAQSYQKMEPNNSEWVPFFGPITGVEVPDIYMSPTSYLISGKAKANYTGSAQTTLMIQTEIDDFKSITIQQPLKRAMYQPNFGEVIFAGGVGRIFFSMTTGNFGTDGDIDTDISIVVPRQVEGWRQAGIPFILPWA